MKKHWLYILFGPLFIFILLVVLPLLFEFDYLIPIKQALSDFDITDIGLQLSRRDEKIEADTNITIISTNKLDNRKLYFLLSEIIKQNPKVIGIDEKVDNEKFPEYRDSVVSLLSSFPNVVFSSVLKNYEQHFDTYTAIDRANSAFLQHASSGFRDIIFGRDRKINTARTFRPKTLVAGELEHSFIYEIVGKYNKESGKYLLNRNNNEEIIDYFGNKNNFFSIDEKDVITSNFVPSVIANKIVLLGKFNLNDNMRYLDHMYFTPLCDMDNGKPYPDMYDVVVQANAIKMVIDYRYYNSVPKIVILIITFVLVYLNFWIFYLISIKIPVWYEILSNLLFLFQSLVILAVIILLYNYLRIQADLTLTLLSIAITVIFFEAYRDNIVPVTKNIFYILKHRRI